MHCYAFMLDGETTYFRLVQPILEYDPNRMTMIMIAADRAVAAGHLSLSDASRGSWVVAAPIGIPIEI